MKQFIYKGLAILALVVLIDITVGAVSKRIFANLPDKDSMLSTIYYSLFKVEGEVVIVGPSSAHHHLNTKIMEDSLGISVYNAALDGRDVVYTDVILQSIFERHNPQTVIMDICAIMLNGQWIDRIHDVKPYYGQNCSVTNYYDQEEDWQQRLKLISSLYRYNKTLSYLIRIQIDRPNVHNGYSPTYGKLEKIERSFYDDFQVDSVEYKHLVNIVEMCKNNGVDLVLIQSPQLGDNIAFDKWVADFSNKNNLRLYSENQNEFWYEHPELFRDNNHLNATGGDVLTRIVCKELLRNK